MIRTQIHDLRDGDIYTEWFDDKNEMFDCVVDWYPDCVMDFNLICENEYIVKVYSKEDYNER